MDDVPNRMAEFEALIERTHDAGPKQLSISFQTIQPDSIIPMPNQK